MADEKKPAPAKGPLEDDLAKIRVAFYLVLVLAVILTGLTIQLGRNEDGSLRFPPKGEFERGATIANVTEVKIHQSPGGAVIGQQKRREFGELREGPVEFGDKEWWRVRYEDAPSGWVDSEEVTASVKLFVALNIIPYSFNYILPPAVVLFLISGLGVMVIRHKKTGVPKVNQKEEEEWMRRNNKVQAARVSISGRDSLSESAISTFRADPRWEHIQSMADSMNVSDWRQAIIEADIILEEILAKIGYEGLTIGDKLKNVEPSDMLTLDDAWQAHKVRNRIAHEGLNYKLSHADVKEAINRYRKVLEEFNVV